jgi:hypothetical protein
VSAEDNEPPTLGWRIGALLVMIVPTFELVTWFCEVTQ